MRRTNQVQSWLQQVEETESRATQLLQQGNPYGSKCFRAKHCWSSFKLGKQVSKMISKVDELKNRGKFDVLAHRLPRTAGHEMPLEKIVDSDSLFERIWSSIEDENAKVIGLYGIGGVGKTTLLKRINNQFSNINHDFAHVIWVVVSRNVDVMKIQETIWTKLGDPNQNGMNRTEDGRAAEIFEILKKKKIVVLLDDIWERFDLSRVGIPYPDNETKSKLIFTTRSEEVCAQMEADRRIRVECMSKQAAFELFCKMVGEETLNCHREIRELAETVAGKCQGLPLALITLGRAMVSRKNPKEWKHAIKTLQNYPSMFSGMQDHVFPILELSYNSLSEDTMKKCFLCCALFPEGYDIPKNELISLWIGEGILNKLTNTNDARNEGEYIIGSLKLACLLEGDECEDVFGMSMGDYVWMHDLIRDMALWLACERGTKPGKFVVIDHSKPFKLDGEEAEKISLWGAKVISGFPIFPKLETLFIRNCGIDTFPGQFLHHVQNLRLLDLTGNTKLYTLPEGIGELVNLEYLDLSWTGMFELPIGIEDLKKLKTLILDNTRRLRAIPRGLIPSLTSLKVFSKLASADFLFAEGFNEVEMLEDLEQLQNLDDLSVNLSTKTAVEKLLESPKLQECVRQVTLMECSEMEALSFPFSTMKRMKHLDKLDIWLCHSMSAIKDLPNENESFVSLRMVHIRLCSVKDLTWLIYAQSLETLEVFNCESLEEVISEDSEQVFSNLSNLCLNDLPNLKCICKHDLVVSSVRKITVLKCPNMKKLPIDSSCNSSLKMIRGERSWWDGLQWENEHLKDVLGAKFQDCEGQVKVLSLNWL